MSFEDLLPQSASELVHRSKTDVQRELDAVDNKKRANVFLPASWLGAIPTAAANRIYDYTLTLKEAIRLNMPDTTEDEFADRWGSIYVGDRTPSTGARGYVIATGTVGSVIGLTSQYQSSDGIVYAVDTAGTITDQVAGVTSIDRVGSTAYVVTDTDHDLSSNVTVTIAGAVESQYNGAKSITVTSANSFSYDVDGSPSTPATGTITAAFTCAKVLVEAIPPSVSSDPYGAATNQSLDSPMTLAVSISGVDTVSYVGFGGIVGGTDTETDDAYKARYLDRIRNPLSHFATSDIDQQIRKTVAGVTRTFIQKSGESVGSIDVVDITRSGNIATVTTDGAHGYFTGAQITIVGAEQPEYAVSDADILVLSSVSFAFAVIGSPVTPATGTITSSAVVPLGRTVVYFMRDGDDDPIPTAPAVDEVKDSILTITPANTPDSFVIVNSPVPVVVDFTFTELSPDSSTMRSAVVANLRQFFSESTSVGSTVDEDAYRSAIFNTVDIETGFELRSFDLASPSGDVPIGTGQIPVLGGVTWAL